MKIILIISLVAAGVFLIKVSFLVYEALGMDFNFNRSWYADTISSDQPEEPEAASSAEVSWKAQPLVELR